MKRICRAAVLLGTLLAAIGLLPGCSRKKNADRQIADQVRVNEIMTVNSHYAPLPDGSCCDWVEFYNASDEAVNLRGCLLSDNSSHPNKWKVPTDWIIAPRGYGVVYLSGRGRTDTEGNLHANFKLSSVGETLLFSNAAGDLIQQIKLPPCSLPNVSYGVREEDGQYAWFLEPTPGAANTGVTAETPEALTLPESGLRLNEYMICNTCVLSDGNGQYSDWVELYNASDEAVSLYGYALSDKKDGGNRWFFPEGASIAAGAYLTVCCSDTPSADRNIYHADFRLSGGDCLTLYAVAGVAVDSVEVMSLNPNVSCGRRSSDGAWRLYASPTPGAANTTADAPLEKKVTAAPRGTLFISEALCVSEQGSAFPDDFIELCNASDKPLSLRGYTLSKNADGPRFTFPEMALEPGKFAVVYCTGEENTDGKRLTAPFKLSRAGEDITLIAPDGAVTDVLTTGRQTAGHSSGRKDSTGGETRLFEKPTPGAVNASGTYAGYAPQPVFSSEGGYVKPGFTVTVSVPKDCVVRVTDDGSVPDEKTPVYDGRPIVVEKTTVLCAAAFREGYLPGEPAYATFLTEEEHAVPVVSLISSPDGLFSYSKGIMSSAMGGLVSGKPNYRSDEKRQAVMQYFVDGKNAVTLRGGLRMAGEYSRAEPQKGMVLLLNESYGGDDCYYPFFGSYSPGYLGALWLRPSGQDWLRAHLRDEFCSRILRDSTVKCDYQEAQPVALYINGKYWGLYYIREKLNEDYLIEKYGWKKGQIDIIKWEGIVQSGSGKEWKDLLDYCETHNLREKESYDYVCSRIDVDSLIDWWVFETYVGNDDTGNIRCCRESGGRWHWMLFDLDDAFHLSYYKENYIRQYAMGTSHGASGCRNSLIRRLLSNPDFRDRFITAYFRHVRTTFDPDRLNAILDELVAEIDPEMDRQCQRWGKPSRSFYEYNLRIIRMIIARKPEIAKQQIREAFGLTDAQVQKYYDAAG